MARVYLGLGTNLGDRLANLRAAVVALGELGQVVRLSSVFETAPLYVTDQPAFFNMAVCLDTPLSPQTLLVRLKALETELGRVTSRRYGPRLIDLDILLHGELVVEQPDLSIPHPRLTERRFALAPLAEIAAEVIHPLTRRSIRQLLDSLPLADDDAVMVVAATLS